MASGTGGASGCGAKGKVGGSGGEVVCSGNKRRVGVAVSIRAAQFFAGKRRERPILDTIGDWRMVGNVASAVDVGSGSRRDAGGLCAGGSSWLCDGNGRTGRGADIPFARARVEA